MRTMLGVTVQIFQCSVFLSVGNISLVAGMMKQHCQQQCRNTKMVLPQQDDKFVITCIAVQEISD